MCINTISNFKQTKKRFLKKQKKKVCDVTCEFYSQGYRFSVRLRGIGLQHLTEIDQGKTKFPLLYKHTVGVENENRF